MATSSSSHRDSGGAGGSSTAAAASSAASAGSGGGGGWVSTLADLDFTFDSSGRLIDKKTGQVFEFNYIRDPSKADSMRRYERLGEVITSYIYQLMRDDHGMQEVPMLASPSDDSSHHSQQQQQQQPQPQQHHSPRPSPASCVYLSPPCHDDSDFLLVIIQGAGVIRAGQWSRRLVINDSLSSGSMLPYIALGHRLNMRLLILNPNANKVRGQTIEGHESPERHVETVWRSLVRRLPQRHVFVLCQGYGGVAFTHQLQGFEPGDASQGGDRAVWEARRQELLQDLRSRVAAVAFCDSFHCLPMQGIGDPEIVDWFRTHSRNWVSSDQPADQPIDMGEVPNWTQTAQDTPRVSAGTPAHERIPSTAMVPVFRWLFSMCEHRVKRDALVSVEQVLRTVEKQQVAAAASANSGSANGN